MDCELNIEFRNNLLLSLIKYTAWLVILEVCCLLRGEFLYNYYCIYYIYVSI